MFPNVAGMAIRAPKITASKTKRPEIKSSKKRIMSNEKRNNNVFDLIIMGEYGSNIQNKMTGGHRIPAKTSVITEVAPIPKRIEGFI